MNDMRFNQPVPPSPAKTEEVSAKKGGVMRFIKIIFVTLVVAAIIVLAIFGVTYYKEKMMSKSEVSSASDYFAIFLTNGQVYFGKMVERGRDEIVISNVYYIQTKDESGTTFSMIKLGNELHGPTDQMFINRSQVLFYEELRKDSKVVEKILADN